MGWISTNSPTFPKFNDSVSGTSQVLSDQTSEYSYDYSASSEAEVSIKPNKLLLFILNTVVCLSSGRFIFSK